MQNVIYAGQSDLFLIVLFLILIGFFILWIKTVVEIATSRYSENAKTGWLILVLLFGLIGIIFYYLVGRKNRIEPKDNSLDFFDEHQSLDFTDDDLL